MSEANTASSTVKTASRPSLVGSRPRISSTCESPRATQAVPSTVVATATVSDWRVCEMPFSTKASGSVTRKPPVIQSGPPSQAPSRASEAPV